MARCCSSVAFTRRQQTTSTSSVAHYQIVVLLVAALFQLAQGINDHTEEMLLPQELRLLPECACMPGVEWKVQWPAKQLRMHLKQTDRLICMQGDRGQQVAAHG